MANHYVLEKLSLYRTLVHGFSTRADGDMEFRRGGERNGRNRTIFTGSLGADPEAVVKMEQVHGTSIALVERTHAGAIAERAYVKGVDGLVSRERGVFLCALTADALPVLFYDPVERVVGLAHVGWRGLVGKLPHLMVTFLTQHAGCRPEHLVVGIGPCIDAVAYTVPAPILQQALPEWRPFYAEEGERIRLDLVAFAQYQLRNAGVPEANIEVGGLCTATLPEEFYSEHARDERERFATVIGIRT